MKKIQKAMGLILVFGLTAGFAACGGGDGGDGGADTGAAKGERVTLEQWSAALASSLAADNVTINGTQSYVYHEEWGGEMHAGSGTVTALMKIANGVMYRNISGTDVFDGETEEWTEESYLLNEDGTYYEYYKENGDTEWSREENYEASHEPNFSMTVQGLVFGDEIDAAYLISVYEELTYDEATGEYIFSINEESDQLEISIKIKNGKLYKLTQYFTDAYAPEGDYDETTYVFVNYGTTTIDGRPNGEDFEDGGVGPGTKPVQPESEESDSVTAVGLTESAWKNAIEATLAQTNFVVNGNVAMEAMGVSESGTETLVFEDEKLYWESNTVTGVYRKYYGTVFSESHGYAVPYVWNWDSSSSSWDCEYSDIGVVTAQNAFSSLDFYIYLDELLYGYQYATFNGGGVVANVDLAELLSDSTVTGTLEITFVGGLVSKIKVEAVGELFEGMTYTERYEYTITYGGATVGNLPAVTI